MRNRKNFREKVLWGYYDSKEAWEILCRLGEEICTVFIDERPEAWGHLTANGVAVCAPKVLWELSERPFVIVLEKNLKARATLLSQGYVEGKDFSFELPVTMHNACCEKKEKNFVLNQGYYSSYQNEEIFDNTEVDVKVLAFYLPQFHTFPENDRWWGKGFTEWTNTRKAKPLFKNHYQPRIPHEDIGYYDLTNPEVLKKQAELAKRHGIYGFCFYYYWFSGYRLMEKPLDMLLSHPEIDINFCLCWANENWSRRWDGRNNDVLIAQQYRADDPKQFILDLKKYVMDKRYIRVHGKPVIIVYKVGDIPNSKSVIESWKTTALECGIGEIYIWSTRGNGDTARSLGLEDLVDREVEFPPRDIDRIAGKSIPRYNILGNPGVRMDYSHLVETILKERMKKPLEKIYRTVTLGWDNTARRKEYGPQILDNFDIKYYYDWLKANVEEAEALFEPDERFVFINAWNEWGEGTYLEPDERFGYTTINTTSRAILKQNFWMSVEIRPRIAVQAHIFHVDITDEIIKYTNYINEPFDIYISTDTCQKAEFIRDKITKSRANKNYIVVMDNRGRDVMPLLLQMNGCYERYKYLLHIHTKKTKYITCSDEWREYLYKSLLPRKNGEEIY